MLRLASLAVFLLVAPPAAEAQTMFKCVLDGKTVYQQEPCPGAAKQDTLKAQSAPSAGAGGSSPANVDAAIEVMAGYQACSDAVSEWDPTHRAAYQEWRSRNASVVARVEKDKEAQRQYTERLRDNRTGSVRTCVKVLDVIKPDRDRRGIREQLK